MVGLLPGSFGRSFASTPHHLYILQGRSKMSNWQQHVSKDGKNNNNGAISEKYNIRRRYFPHCWDNMDGKLGGIFQLAGPKLTSCIYNFGMLARNSTLTLTIFLPVFRILFLLFSVWVFQEKTPSQWARGPALKQILKLIPAKSSMRMILIKRIIMLLGI